MKAAIFGVNGQDGHFLSELMKREKIDVLGSSRSNCNFIGDVGDLAFVDAFLKSHLPDFIFHFAANSSTRHETLFENHRSISNGTLNILESARRYCPNAKIFLSGSAMQFKNEGQPIDEQTPFEASSPYAIARIQSVYAGRYYRAAFGMAVYCGYLFNHDSAYRSERHVNQKITSTVRRIAAGSDEILEIGDVDVEKEFNFAGDVVEAIWALINQHNVYEAVIGSGEAHSIREWIGYCFSAIGKNWKDHTVVLPNYKADYKRLVSNPSLIRSLGWRPRTGFHQLANMMLDGHDRHL